MKHLAGLVLAIAVYGFGVCDIHAEAVSKNKYLESVIVLFKDFLQMGKEGVFMSSKTVKRLKDSGFVFPNRIRGDNPPGGYFGRPPGSNWIKRVKALQDDIKQGDVGFVCFDIPKLPGGGGVCSFDLFELYGAVFGKNQISRLDAIASKLWLATICYETQGACKPYSN